MQFGSAESSTSSSCRVTVRKSIYYQHVHIVSVFLSPAFVPYVLWTVARNGLYFPNQICFLKCGGHSPPTGALTTAPPPGLRPCNPFRHISYDIYQYYCYKMFLLHRVVIENSQYHSTDTRNISLRRIFQKISCVPQRSAILGLDRFISPSPERPILPPRYTIYYY